MHELGADAAGRQSRGNEVLEELLQPELGEGGGAAEDQHGAGKRVRHTFQTTPGRSSGLAAVRPGPSQLLARSKQSEFTTDCTDCEPSDGRAITELDS